MTWVVEVFRETRGGSHRRVKVLGWYRSEFDADWAAEAWRAHYAGKPDRFSVRRRLMAPPQKPQDAPGSTQGPGS